MMGKIEFDVDRRRTMLASTLAVVYYYGSFTSYYGGKAVLGFTEQVCNNKS